MTNKVKLLQSIRETLSHFEQATLGILVLTNSTDETLAERFLAYLRFPNHVNAQRLDVELRYALEREARENS